MLSFQEMKSLCQEISPVLTGKTLENCLLIGQQKWQLEFSDGHHLVVCIRPRICCFYCSEKKRSGSIDPLAERILFHLQGHPLIRIELLYGDRILALKFETLALVFELFSNRPNGHIIEGEGLILYSLKPSGRSFEAPSRPFTFEEHPLCCTSHLVERALRELEKEGFFEEKKRAIEKELRKKITRLQRQLKTFESEILEGKKWEEEKHAAELLQTYFFRLEKDLDHIVVEDWLKNGKETMIHLEPGIPPEAQLKKRFALSKKLKRKMEHALEFIEVIRRQLSVLQEEMDHLQKISQFDELRSFEKHELKPSQAKSSKVVVKVPFRRFTSESGLSIFVGKDENQNDQLSFQFSKGSDLWFHTSNYAGPHVIIRTKKGEAVDAETIADAAQLALYYSQGKKAGEDEVVMTECKHLSRTKKKGQVNVARAQTLKVRLNPQRLKRLLPFIPNVTQKLGFRLRQSPNF